LNPLSFFIVCETGLRMHMYLPGCHCI